MSLFLLNNSLKSQSLLSLPGLLFSQSHSLISAVFL